MKPRFVQGFTLIEVLVALAIFGIMSTMAYQALGQSLSNADLLTARMDRIQAIQRTMSLVGRDLMQAAPRPVRDLLGDGHIPSMRTSLNTEFALEVTRGGWPNPAGLPRGTLQRVAWRIEDDELLRYHWNVLDPTLANEPVITQMIDDVESILFRYRTAGGEWTEQWPPLGAQGVVAQRIRPQVVEVVLTLTDEGELRRFFEVAP
jgi:general secretion pathway protein J